MSLAQGHSTRSPHRTLTPRPPLVKSGRTGCAVAGEVQQRVKLAAARELAVKGLTADECRVE